MMQKIGIVILLCYMIIVEGERHKVALDPLLNPKLLEGPLLRKVKIDDYMDITCPQYDIDDPESERLQFNLYNLSFEAYKNCEIKNESIIFTCDKPTRTMILTTKFQKSSPSPLGFTFRDGHDYYYVGIPLGQKKPNCKKAITLIVTVEKKRHNHVSKPVVPPIRTLPKTSSTTTTTTTISTTTTSTTSKIIKAVSAGSSISKTTEKNSASSVHYTFVTSLFTLLTLLLHL